MLPISATAHNAGLVLSSLPTEHANSNTVRYPTRTLSVAVASQASILIEQQVYAKCPTATDSAMLKATVYNAFPNTKMSVVFANQSTAQGSTSSC